MSKRIVLCSDGTGNAGGKGRGTNVWRVFLGVDQRGHEIVNPATGKPPTQQLAFYDDGVGTSTSRISAVLGLAFGVGLSRNIRQLYTSLVRNYEDGDELYLFGFSRGAFTIRSLAGMIDAVGVLPASGHDLEASVKDAYRAYRHQLGASPETFREKWEKKHQQKVHRPKIHFLGVWDTVSAIGVPFSGFRKVVYALARSVRRPHAAGLNPSLVHVRHAAAIDEARHSFKLELFDEHGLVRDPGTGELQPRNGWNLESLEQVWFAGVHSNVGGGYPKKGMERVALAWMMSEAGGVGLRYNEGAHEAASQGANVNSKLYDSRRGLAVYYRYRSRNVQRICDHAGAAVKVHRTALDRIARSTEGYAPINLPTRFELVGGRSPSQAEEPGDDRTKLLQSADNTGRKSWRTVSLLRELLYYPFLALSVLLLAVLLSLSAVENGTFSGEGVSPRLERVAVSLVDRAEALARPLDRLLGSAGTMAQERLAMAAQVAVPLAKHVVPDFLVEPIDGLIARPGLLGLFVIAGLLLFEARRRLINRAKALGEARWRPATAGSPPAPPSPRPPG